MFNFSSSNSIAMKDHYIFCGNQTICNATYRYFVPESYRNTFELLVDGRGGALSNLLFQVPTYSDDMNVSSFNTPDYAMTSFTDIDEQLVGPALQYMAGSMGILTLCSVVLLLVLLLSSPAQVGRAQYWSNVIGLACESALGISRVWLCIYGSISSSQFALARGYSYTGFSTGWYAASGFGEVLTVLGLVFAEIVLFLQGREILNQLKAKSTKMVYTAVVVWFLMLAFVSIVLRIVMVALYFDRLRPLDSILSSSYSEDSYQGMYAWDMVITLQNIAQRLSLGFWTLLSLIRAIKLLLLKLRGVATTTEQTWVWTIPHGILVFIVRSQIIPCKLGIRPACSSKLAD